MKKSFILLTIASITVLIFFLLSSQSKLGEIRMQSIFFRKGEKLSVVAKTFEKAMQDDGNDWFVIVDPRILDRPAKMNFGARDAKNMTYLISKTYDAKSIVYERNRLILYIPKKN